MKKSLHYLCLCCIIVASALTARGEVKLTYQEKYGDHMGTSAACQAKDYFFYDANGTMVRQVYQTAGVSGEFEVQNVYYYNFNEKGLLTSLVNYQWRPAYSDWSLTDSTAYEYDEQGRCIAEIGGRDTYSYTYDNQGNIIKKEQIVTITGQVIQTCVYSDFVEGTVNKPRKYVADGAYSNYTYSGTYEYDSQYRLVVDDRLTSTESKMQRIEYTYDDNGVCVNEKLYTSPSWFPEEIVAGSEADTLRFSREIVRTNKGLYYERKEKVLTEVDYDADFNPILAWQEQIIKYHEYYANVDATTAPVELGLTNISTAATPNTVKVVAKVPASPVANAQYIVWRDWEAVATVEAVDGTIEYIDSNVSSGVHTYFVQSYDAVNGIYYNVTPLTVIDMNVTLAPVTNMRLVRGYKTTAKDAMTGTEYDTYMIELKWDAPVCDFEVLSYEVYQKPFAMPIATVEAAENSVVLSMPIADGEEADLRVDVVYALGTVEGQYVHFSWDSSVDFDGEQTVSGVYSLVIDDDGGECIVNLYNADNNISRSKSLMYSGNGGYSPNYQYYYNYVDGLLDEYYFIQYKDMGVWTDPKDHTYYTYDEEGRLVSSENVYTYNDFYEYTYDEQGRLTGYTRKGKTNRNSPDAAYDKLYHTVEYSKFDENGNPGRMDYIDGLYATGTYYVLYSYDANGNVLSEIAWKPSTTDPDNENAKTPYYMYENKYDENNVIVERIKSNNNYEGGFVYASKETRTKLSDNVYEFALYNYDEYNKEWALRNTSTETYALISSVYAPRNLNVVTALDESASNAVELTCDVPKTEVPNAQYIIWCDWQPVDTVAAVDGKIKYSFSSLENNREIEFMVQSYDAVNNVPYNVSEVAVAFFATYLPPVTNLHYISTSAGEYNNEGNIIPALWVKFEWDAPETDLEISHYNIYMDGWAVPFHTTTNTVDSVYVFRENDFNSPDQQKEVQVEVSVEYVLGESEGVVEVFAVENVSVDAVESIRSAYVAGDCLVVDGDAVVTIYNAAGALVAQYKHNARIPLTALHTGVYVARVEVEGALQIVKIVRN